MRGTHIVPSMAHISKSILATYAWFSREWSYVTPGGGGTKSVSHVIYITYSVLDLEGVQEPFWLPLFDEISVKAI